MISFEGISHHFGSTQVLRDVSVKISASTTAAIIGPSGCGKSTLLRILAGLVVPNKGTASVGGQILSPQSLHSVRDRLGYVIQSGGLFPHLTVKDNVTIRARQASRKPDWIDERLAELCQLTQFPADAVDRYPNELSGGQLQRVSLMRALMMDPDVLLLDEPLGALDPMIRRDLQNELREIFHGLKKTVLFVTHDLQEAAWFGYQVILMNEGRIVQAGTARELVDKPANDFVTRFINAQRTGLFEGTP